MLNNVKNIKIFLLTLSLLSTFPSLIFTCALTSIETKYIQEQENLLLQQDALNTACKSIGLEKLFELIKYTAQETDILISVGSGKGSIEFLFEQALKLSEIQKNIICIDPDPGSHQSGELYKEPEFNDCAEFIEKGYNKHDTKITMLLNWPNPGWTGTYDIESIKKINPEFIIAAVERYGQHAGSIDFLNCLNNLETGLPASIPYKILAQKRCIRKHYFAGGACYEYVLLAKSKTNPKNPIPLNYLCKKNVFFETDKQEKLAQIQKDQKLSYEEFTELLEKIEHAQNDYSETATRMLHLFFCNNHSQMTHIDKPEIAKQFCATCKKSNIPLMRCASCKTTKYCSDFCQKISWHAHKHMCLLNKK